MVMVVLISVLSSAAMNQILLSPFYYRQQEHILERVGDQIDALYQGEISEEITDALNQLGYNINGLILIYDEEGVIQYSSRPIPMRSIVTMTEDFIVSIKTYGFPQVDQNGLRRGREDGQGLSTEEEEALVTVERVLSNGDYLFMQTSKIAMEESIAIFTRFSIFPALVAFFAAIALALLVTRKISKPIVELTAITQRMKSLDFSSQYTDDADDEIGELGRNFNDMAQILGSTIEELNQANRKLKEDIEREKAIEEARKNFISNVSHELKTPISLIRGYAEGIRDQVIGPEDVEDYLSVIIDESEEMSSMVKELLTLSKLESHHVTMQWDEVDVQDVVERVIHLFALDVQKDHIVLDYLPSEERIKVVADESMIETVLINYMSNAIDHVEGHKRIQITLDVVDTEVIVRVFNTGEPIPSFELDKIWDSFYKVDKARTRGYGGTGLGLTIVKNMVELHHGRYGVENREDGVEFFAAFPNRMEDGSVV